MNDAIKNFKDVYKNNRYIYDEISKATNVPPVLIAAIHYRESGNNFNYSIRNGQQVVSGISGFISDAEEWLGTGMSKKQIYITQDASVAMMLTYAELHNGTAYAQNNHVNPYLYSGTNIYISGKYVEKKVDDGNRYTVFDETQVDAQVGVYAIITSVDKKEWYLKLPKDIIHNIDLMLANPV